MYAVTFASLKWQRVENQPNIAVATITRLTSLKIINELVISVGTWQIRKKARMKGHELGNLMQLTCLSMHNADRARMRESVSLPIR